MEQSTRVSVLARLYVVLLATILLGVTVHAPLTIWLGTLWPDYDLPLKAWKEVLLVVAAVIASVLVYRSGRAKDLLRDKLMLLIAVYGGLHLLLLPIFNTGMLGGVAGLMIDLRYLVYFVLVYVAIWLFPQYRSMFMKAALIGAGIVIGFGVLQVFVLPPNILEYLGYGRDTIMPYLTVDQNQDYIRINSTLRGPNPLGAYVGTVLAIGVAAALRRTLPVAASWRVIAGTGVIGGLVVLWASYSRSALVAAVVAIGIVLVLTIGRRLSRRAWIIGVVIAGALLGGLVAARDSDFISHVILHEDPNEGNALNSNDEHIGSLVMGTERLLDQPFGAGIGSTGSASLYGDEPLIIENQYLFIAHETGWLGLALFMVIFGFVLYRLWLARSDYLALGLLASGVGLALIGVLLPVWADDTVSLVWWGLAGVALGSYDSK